MIRKKPRKHDLTTTFDLTVKDGDTPILKVKRRKMSELDEVLAILRKKL